MTDWKSFPGWLKGAPVPMGLENAGTPSETAALEAKAFFRGEEPVLEKCVDWGDRFRILEEDGRVRIRGGETGLLYGVWQRIRDCLCGRKSDAAQAVPQHALRMLQCWDNMDGTVERGYSGRSLWFEGGSFSYDPQRIRALGRLLSSVGINCLCINNVNVREPAQGLIEEKLGDLAALAALFRPFGIRLMVSVDFSQPLRAGLGSADPLDPDAAAWWQRQTDRVYAAVPDLAGYLVKADSEHRPGPFTYGRTHAEGAHMLSAALKKHGGILVWRAFVYNCMQDWRDSSTDRPCAAYQTYAPLDGQFDDNVILQIKHGPFDFQVREPVSPLFFAMPRTRLAMEVQLAQEYTGHQIDLYFMPPMWREIYRDLGDAAPEAIAAVSNLGRDACWTGNPLAMANLFSYGLFAWSRERTPEECAGEWTALTYGFAAGEGDRLVRALLSSRRIYEKYTSPLGLCWMVTPGLHYGPSPDGYEYQMWGTYHRADRNAVGIDRTEKGTGYLTQYPPEMRGRYERVQDCPDRYLLFFHRVRYDHVMGDGRTLIQRIYDDHFEGCAEAEQMASDLEALPFPPQDRTLILDRLGRQKENAREWRDVINTFFFRLSGAGDIHGRRIWP